mmetsp:Transcript_22001/g.39572  ORF Transcript_22001/g.39572 Transcript_22001/m.39572 type:complete len:222 (+) Transcript_22001:2531-3196(+)
MLSSKLTRIRSLTNKTPHTQFLSLSYTGTRECPVCQMAVITSSSNRVSTSSMYTSSMAVMMSCTIAVVNSIAAFINFVSPDDIPVSPSRSAWTSNSWDNSFLSKICPMSRPNARSKIREIGLATTNRRTMNNWTMGAKNAPITKPWRLQIAWGTISPKMTMNAVEAISPINPPVTSDIKIDNAEFTATFPNNSVHSKRLPFFRTGNIFLAFRCSDSDPDAA